MGWLVTVVGVVGGIVGAMAGIASLVTWAKVNRKVAMLTNSEDAFEVVPAWYTSRMMDDHWLFGLATVSGHTLVIGRILSISSDGKWMNVHLVTKESVPDWAPKIDRPVFAVADDRNVASVRIDSVCFAYEIVTS